MVVFCVTDQHFVFLRVVNMKTNCIIIELYDYFPFYFINFNNILRSMACRVL